MPIIYRRQVLQLTLQTLHSVKLFNMQNDPKAIVLILAHPDDEVFLIPYLSDIYFNNKSIHVIYLTDGQGFRHKFNCDVRFDESRKFLSNLNKNVNWNFYFLGKKSRIDDSKLYLNLDLAFNQIFRLINSIKPDKVISLCPEGGHPDHDAVSIISAVLSRQFSSEFLCFSCYRNSKFFPFTLLPHNDDSTIIVEFNLDFAHRFKIIYSTLLIPFTFRTQWRTWIGLFPILLALNIFMPKFKLYKVDISKFYRFNKATLYQKRMGINSLLVRQYLFDFVTKYDKKLYNELIKNKIID